MAVLTYRTLRVHRQESIFFVQIDRPDAGNTINAELIGEFGRLLRECEQLATVVVLSGSSEVFCTGADFTAIARSGSGGDPAPLYDIWQRLATGPFVSVCHVQGKANAGGIGFVAACDVALARDTAQFGLSELLFGLYPACVLPFLIQRVGYQKAHYLTITTSPIDAGEAHRIGLVDAVDADSEALLRRHLLRLRRISKPAIERYKSYMAELSGSLHSQRARALAGNHEIFSDQENLASIGRFVEHGIFPWEKT